MIELLITAQGIVRALYTEAIPLQELGRLKIERASHVEPDASGRWQADLQPSQGPVLGPFTSRSQALLAEQNWLTQHVLFNPTCVTHHNQGLLHYDESAQEIGPTIKSSIRAPHQEGLDCPDIS